MADFVYTMVTGKIPKLLAKIREVGVPPKVTNAWIKTIGFTSSNDSGLIPVLRFIGLTDASNVPTDAWSQYRGAKHRQVLGHQIREGYSELYAIYPNAHDQSDADLESVFSTTTKGGKQVIKKMVATFKGLTAEADFSGKTIAAKKTVRAEHHAPVAETPVQQMTPVSEGGSSPSLHIDMQIHISPEASADQIEQIFASMAKHLYSKKK